MKKIIFVMFILLYSFSSYAFAAVGCTLNDPDRDVKRLFPESTGYRTDFISIKEIGGETLFQKIEQELGDKLDTVYETIDVPYSFYGVLKGKEVIGQIHGVNQKGKYGGMQLILATNLEGKVLNFYYQKMSSPEASKFMDKNFTRQFIGLTLEDFLKGNLKISDPSKANHEDFLATLRGLKKNLILLKELKLNSESQSK
ncbi:MAG: hypothetical protein PHH69_02115 [Candidatus Omnitrophica bacterium]|nr:hypothetical protein [Candidatus Omnitrophota bacterium]MDD5610325.1 hypothetical protein [Candidatus Omnitrophota bacterium]